MLHAGNAIFPGTIETMFPAGDAMFQDRRDAGRALAQLVAAVPNLGDAVLLALPRGGVPVAFEVARACKLPLDILGVRKIGAPGQRELAMGAVASGGTTVLNPDVLRFLRISEPTLNAAIEQEQLNLRRMEAELREGSSPIAFDGRAAILVDDGLATGATMRAAICAVRPRARVVIVAVPVGARSTCTALRGEADALICALEPELLDAVGRFYRDFDPTSDDEVRALLAAVRGFGEIP
ncbi:MAG: phosphoribosyltransferase family protein [Terracidiphilus sp.]